jgi:hypothetical protein
VPAQARRDTTYKHCPLPTPEDRLLFILVYLKQHPTQLLHGCLFGMRQSKATPWSHVLWPVLRNALRAVGDAPCRRVQALREHLGVEGASLPLEASPADEVPAGLPAAPPLFVMVTPSDPSRAPQDATAQKTCDRGKQRRHMLKNLLLVNRALRVLFLRETHPGRVHDKRLADTTPSPLPAGSQLRQDLGFQAFTLDGVDIIPPTKKSRGHE